VLPLCGAFTEPSVIRYVHQEIRVRFNIFASEMRKNVLETNEHGCFNAQFREGKLDGPVTSGKTAFNRRKPFHKRKPADQWNIFTEDYQPPLAIPIHQFAFGIDQETAVKVIGLPRPAPRLARFGII